MKKEFNMIVIENETKKVVKKEGDYDTTNAIYYTKEDTGWTATDAYTGTSIVVNKPTKKDCQDSIKTFLPKLKKIRNGENYLKGVINYQELIEK